MFFDRFRRFRTKRAAASEEVARQIFAYESRGKKRYCDPLMVAMALQTDARFTNEHLRKAKKHDPESLEIVAAAGARAFQVERLNGENGQGATVAELVGLVDAFDLWCFQLQKKT